MSHKNKKRDYVGKWKVPRMRYMTDLLIWRVRDHYYDRKKKIQLSVWRVRDHYYDRNKKKIQSSVWQVHDHVCLSCCDRYICISSTGIKPNTNLLVQLQYIRYI